MAQHDDALVQALSAPVQAPGASIGQPASPAGAGAGAVSAEDTAASPWPDAIVALGKVFAANALARRNQPRAPAQAAFGGSRGVPGGPFAGGVVAKPPAGISRKRKGLTLA